MSTEIVDLKTKIQEKKTASIPEIINASLKELGKALPEGMSAERISRIALTTFRLNPKLAECTPQSFMGALFQCAQLGLEPNVDGQAYMIPYTNKKNVNGKWIEVKEVQFQIGYKGLISLYYRTIGASTIDMQKVCENDLFEYEIGSEQYIRHIPKLKDRGETIAYYAIATMKDGHKIFRIMGKEECLEHGKKHSKGFNYDSSNWVKEQDAMCLKTVLIQLMKVLPKSAEMQKILDMDSTTKSIDIKKMRTIDMTEVKDETDWSEDDRPE